MVNYDIIIGLFDGKKFLKKKGDTVEWYGYSISRLDLALECIDIGGLTLRNPKVIIPRELM
jgi:hypothetical protein